MQRSEGPTACLPPEFLERLAGIIPPDRLAETLHSFACDRPLVLRVNTLRTKRDDVQAALRKAGLHPEPVTWLADAVILPLAERSRALAHPIYAEGLIYPQGLSSQLAARLLDPQPGETVLDLCAAPGGKTAHIACCMQGRGRIIAIEAVKKRFFKLRGNLASQHIDTVETRLMDGRSAWRVLADQCDRVMLDAPCSSEARFAVRNPSSWRYWSLRKIRELRHKQKGLIRSGFRCLKPGGVMLYATCSFAPEENESVVNDALRVFGEEMLIEPISLPAQVPLMPGLKSWRGRLFDARLQQAVRILPDACFTGFFLCRIRRR